LNFFLFLNVFLFSCSQNFNSTNPAKLLYKTILSDEFNMAAIGNSLIIEPYHCHAHCTTLRQ